jgi:tellurite resistance protein TerC
MHSSSAEPARRESPRDEEPGRDSLSRSALRHVRRVIVLVVGLTVLAIGVAMIVLPGPATVVIPAGLGILAIEFTWARRLLDQLKKQGSRVLGRD